MKKWVLLSILTLLSAPAPAAPITTKTGGCKPLAPHAHSPDVEVRDGEGAGGVRVAPADISPPILTADDLDPVSIGLGVPLSDYTNRVSDEPAASDIYIGEMTVGKDGAALNGRELTPQSIYSTDCP